MSTKATSGWCSGKNSSFNIATDTKNNSVLDKALSNARNSLVRLQAALQIRDVDGAKVWFQQSLVWNKQLAILTQKSHEETEDQIIDLVSSVFGEEQAIQWCEESIGEL